MPERHRVAVEAEPAARERLVAILGDAIDVVPRERADVVLLDAPGRREALPFLATSFTIPTVVLLDDPHADLARTALAAGAAAVLARQSDVAELRAALDAVAAGLLVLDPAARDAFALPLANSAVAHEELTERERQVLRMLVAGLSNRRIAERLTISENTVKAHVAAILAKLGATTRTEAVTTAVRLGLVML